MSAARLKPWKAEGMSKATWYRSRQKASETNSSAPKNTIADDERDSSPECLVLCPFAARRNTSLARSGELRVPLLPPLRTPTAHARFARSHSSTRRSPRPKRPRQPLPVAAANETPASVSALQAHPPFLIGGHAQKKYPGRLFRHFPAIPSISASSVKEPTRQTLLENHFHVKRRKLDYECAGAH